ncbi:serine/threonine-protein phosphatase 7 long form-like protein, partial [Trifolium medium]|nr:serine/threonine-protein phosphatase 7 long form-like protein [Trifolium medium]
MGQKCTEQLVNISNWTLDGRIKDRLKGLHITGKPVTGTDDDPVTWSQKCFGENLCKVSRYNKLQGSIRLNVLKEKFMIVPDNANDEVLDRHARAYVCYMLGSSLFSTYDHDIVPTMYLPLIFIMLSLPKIKSSIIASVENGNQNESFPLIVDWSKNLKDYNTRRKVEFLDIIDTMTDTEVVYNPYVSLKFTRDQDLTFKVQDCVCSIATPLINFNEIAFYKPYECKKQYPGRHTKKLDDKWELFYRRGARSKEHWGNNWTTKTYHKKFISQWDQSCFSKRPFAI